MLYGSSIIIELTQLPPPGENNFRGKEEKSEVENARMNQHMALLLFDLNRIRSKQRLQALDLSWKTVQTSRWEPFKDNCNSEWLSKKGGLCWTQTRFEWCWLTLHQTPLDCLSFSQVCFSLCFFAFCLRETRDWDREKSRIREGYCGRTTDWSLLCLAVKSKKCPNNESAWHWDKSSILGSDSISCTELYWCISFPKCHCGRHRSMRLRFRNRGICQFLSDWVWEKNADLIGNGLWNIVNNCE